MASSSPSVFSSSGVDCCPPLTIGMNSDVLGVAKMWFDQVVAHSTPSHPDVEEKLVTDDGEIRSQEIFFTAICI